MRLVTEDLLKLARLRGLAIARPMERAHEERPDAFVGLSDGWTVGVTANL